MQPAVKHRADAIAKAMQLLSDTNRAAVATGVVSKIMHLRFDS